MGPHQIKQERQLRHSVHEGHREAVHLVVHFDSSADCVCYSICIFWLIFILIKLIITIIILLFISIVLSRLVPIAIQQSLLTQLVLLISIYLLIHSLAITQLPNYSYLILAAIAYSANLALFCSSRLALRSLFFYLRFSSSSSSFRSESFRFESVRY